MGGRVGIGTLYLPPRLSAPGIQVAPGATGTCSGRGGGRGGEDQGIIGPPSIPLSPGAAPKKKTGTGGRAVEGGGGNQPFIKPTPGANPPPSFPQTINPKSLWFGWELEGGRGRGPILIIIRPRWLRGQAHLASDLFLGGLGKGPKYPIISRELLKAL